MLGLRQSLNVIAGVSVTSWRPRGNGIGSSNGRFQPRSATSEPLRRFPVRRHALAAVKAPVLLGSPRPLIAPGLKIGIGALRQKHAPRGLKIGARLVKGCSYAIRTFP